MKIIKREVGKYYFETFKNFTAVVYAYSQETDYYVSSNDPERLSTARPSDTYTDFYARRLATKSEIDMIQKFMKEDEISFKPLNKIIEIW